jgi:hypothetical protein
VFAQTLKSDALSIVSLEMIIKLLLVKTFSVYLEK